ncbi:MAG: BrnA antitoxin family protein [Candidatus Accumulibacter sp.]|jgi:uncharacterized protein (DUF4415 family)|nr:BrnA antitoxin family protein [Accumulibacter sp.]
MIIWEKLVAEAPGEDRPPTPEENAAWSRSFVSHSQADLKEKLAARRRRGPGKAARKTPTTIRFDPDVLLQLKATGQGWQTRVNGAMREWLKTRPV